MTDVRGWEYDGQHETFKPPLPSGHRHDELTGLTTSLDTRLDTAETDITALEAADAIIGGALNAAEAQILDHEARLDAIEADSGWIWVSSLGYVNGWTDFTGWHPQYRKVGNIVWLRGLIDSGTISAAAFTLPVGYRPSTELIFAVISNDALGQVRVGTGGIVFIAPPSNTTWVSLTGVTFSIG